MTIHVAIEQPLRSDESGLAVVFLRSLRPGRVEVSAEAAFGSVRVPFGNTVAVTFAPPAPDIALVASPNRAVADGQARSTSPPLRGVPAPARACWPAATRWSA